MQDAVCMPVPARTKLLAPPSRPGSPANPLKFKDTAPTTKVNVAVKGKLVQEAAGIDAHHRRPLGFTLDYEREMDASGAKDANPLPDPRS